jgi:hypothetical protein
MPRPRECQQDKTKKGRRQQRAKKGGGGR